MRRIEALHFRAPLPAVYAAAPIQRFKEDNVTSFIDLQIDCRYRLVVQVEAFSLNAPPGVGLGTG